MNPLASAATAQYESVFGLASSFWDGAWPPLLFTGLLVGGIVIFLCGAFAADEGDLQKFLMGLGVCASLASFVFPIMQGLTAKHEAEALLAHMNNNLKQKYGVTLSGKGSGLPVDSRGEIIMDDEILAEQMNLTIALPDGTTAPYSVRFDRNTSEPFVLNSQNVSQLNQTNK